MGKQSKHVHGKDIETLMEPDYSVEDAIYMHLDIIKSIKPIVDLTRVMENTLYPFALEAELEESIFRVGKEIH